MARIFISYSRKDTDQLRELARALEAAGHSVWWDVRSIQAGADWQRAIDTGIVDSDAVVLLLSAHSVASEWVTKELEIARAKHKAILPVRIDEIDAKDFPEFIRDENIHVLEAHPDLASGFVRLTDDLLGLQEHGPRLPFTPTHPRLVEFVGRDDELNEIHVLLSEPKGTGRARVAVCGMAGIGKTQLCIEYVHRYRYFYPDGIIYLDAQLNLNEQLARLARLLGLALPAETLPAEERRDFSAEAVTQHLQGLKRALVFLDNVPSIQALRQAYIGHSTPILALPAPILLNSRSRIEGPEIASIDLTPLSNEDATSLLSKGRRELRNDPQLTELLRVLGGVPLALALAAAFFSKKPRATPRSYLAELEEHGWEATLSLGHLKPGDIEAYPQTSFVPALRAQWALLDLDSSRTLLAASALHPPNTPIPIVRLGILSGLSDDSDGMKTELSDSVFEVVTLSLATDAGASRLMLHAVVHDFIRRQAFIDYDEEKKRCGRNAKAALEHFPTVESLFLNRGIDGLVDDLLAMHGMFEPDFASLCGDWLSIMRGHSYVFRTLAPARANNGFAQHVLLFSRVRKRDQIGAMVKRTLAESGQPFFDVRWSSWFIPEQQRTRLLGDVADRSETKFLALAPDAAWALSYTTEGIVQVWELPSGRLHGRTAVRGGRSLAVAPSGDRLALLEETGVLHLLDLPSLRITSEWPAPAALSTIEFARNDLLVGVSMAGDRLLCLELSGRVATEIDVAWMDSPVVRIFRLNDDELFLALKGGRFAIHHHAETGPSVQGQFGSEQIEALAARRDGEDIIVCTTAGLFKVDGREGNAQCINEHFGTGWYSHAAFFGDGRYAVSVAYRNTIALVDLTRPDELHSLSSNTADDLVAGALKAPVFVAGNSYYSELYVWDLTDGVPQTTDKYHAREIVNILTVGNGSRFVTTSMDWSAALWDRNTGHKVQRYSGQFYGYAKGLAKTVADDRFFVGYTFKTCLYDVKTGEELGNFQPPCDGVTAIAMAPSGKFFLTGSSDGWLLLWDEYGQMLAQWQIGESEIASIAISSDEKIIVGGMASGAVFALVSSALRQWPGERGFVSSVCLSPDGKLVYTAHHNGEVCAWSTVTGDLDHVFQGHSERVSEVKLVEDGRVLITASHDGSIRFWSTSRREQVEVLQLGQAVSCLDYYKDDTTLLIGLAVGDVVALNRVGPFGR